MKTRKLKKYKMTVKRAMSTLEFFKITSQKRDNEEELLKIMNLENAIKGAVIELPEYVYELRDCDEEKDFFDEIIWE